MKEIFMTSRFVSRIMLLALALWSLPSLAFLTVQESNEVTPAGKYKLGVEPQFRTSNGNGFNFGGFFDIPINEEASFRANAGTGETDFFAGTSFKWVPIPY